MKLLHIARVVRMDEMKAMNKKSTLNDFWKENYTEKSLLTITWSMYWYFVFAINWTLRHGWNPKYMIDDPRIVCVCASTRACTEGMG